MKGHIKITDKVKFVYYELPKPDLQKFRKHRTWSHVGYVGYQLALNEYEASKKTVEVSNSFHHEDGTYTFIEDGDISLRLENNTYCEAEVTDTAIITKLL